jgi:hypothetical protein
MEGHRADGKSIDAGKNRSSATNIDIRLRPCMGYEDRHLSNAAV